MQNVRRAPTIARNGMVVSSHHLASATGMSVLRGGGNAVDAAIAANAVLSVVEPAMCGLGGDLFMLIWEAKTRKLHALNASGRSPYGVDLGWFRERGITKMPLGGAPTISTPGAIDGWVVANERFGRKPLRELLEPAIGYAADGYPLHGHLSRRMHLGNKLLAGNPIASEIYLRDGKPAVVGEMMRNPRMAGALRSVAEEGRATLYEGGLLGRAVLSTCEALGWPLTQRDLSDQHAEWVEPITTSYRGKTIVELPPPNQGMTTQIAMNVLEGYDLRQHGFGTTEAMHLQLEATRAAFDARNRLCADPAFFDVPLQELLSADYAERVRRAIDSARTSRQPAPATAPSTKSGDTIYLCTADGEGNCVSLIQSLYATWGSGIMAGDLGFFLQSRNSGLVLDANHPSGYQPRKRPFHTLAPAMIFENGEPWLLYGTRGADAQPQVQIQLLCNLVDFGMNLQEALDAPRWRISGTYQDPEPAIPLLESRFSPETFAGLQSKGHTPRWMEAADDDMGHASAIIVDRTNGTLLGAYDLRSDGAAVGY